MEPREMGDLREFCEALNGGELNEVQNRIMRERYEAIFKSAYNFGVDQLMTRTVDAAGQLMHRVLPIEPTDG